MERKQKEKRILALSICVILLIIQTVAENVTQNKTNEDNDVIELNEELKKLREIQDDYNKQVNRIMEFQDRYEEIYKELENIRKRETLDSLNHTSLVSLAYEWHNEIERLEGKMETNSQECATDKAEIKRRYEKEISALKQKQSDTETYIGISLLVFAGVIGLYYFGTR